MSDTAGVPAPKALPERVFVVARDTDESGEWGMWVANAAYSDDAPYVPEQRALEAEEARELWRRAQIREEDKLRQASADLYGAEVERNKLADECNKLAAMVETLRAERDALQADLAALVPLARYWLAYLDLEPTLSDTAETIAARAILDREAP